MSAAHAWIRRLEAEAREVRNLPLADLCGKALQGDPEALHRVEHIHTTGRDIGRGPLTAAERSKVADLGLDPDKIESSMLARQAGNL